MREINRIQFVAAVIISCLAGAALAQDAGACGQPHALTQAHYVLSDEGEGLSGTASLRR